ncbi:TIGR03757 family integrating conjugative element protein [Halopseudomonas bauzanensis]|uniref:Integrating conjugative element protein, PFL_4709 family n=1 Tax=Halopseudomonas bauzanensis TaxID=653930 RepID=A0A1H9TSE3_9GAMM|nr:TIGR03757 family integrating conjugative element protein [Halopseudomonas bauzanensis]SES00220.1 integrating conjugative element protein, PFL_4709 family [Halopseudomonas bauzanensis]SFM01799.1 integrating conjugative element protein, PFL_4709 family [Halopseudomonas bauzanensis]
MRTRRWIKTSVIALNTLSISMLLSAPASAGIEVFSASHLTLSNVPPHAVVVELDALVGLDEVLSLGLPANPDQAGSVALERMQGERWAEMLERYEHAALAVSRAWVLGVEKIPAVVVDGNVVYGETDVARAVYLIEEAMSHAE